MKSLLLVLSILLILPIYGSDEFNLLSQGNGEDIFYYTGGNYWGKSIQLGDALLFARTEEEQGTELWRTDGTNTGTFLLKDIITGTTSSYPNDYVLFNNKVYFSVFRNSGDDGITELWETDGTESGTVFRLVLHTMTSEFELNEDSRARLHTIFNNKIIFSVRPYWLSEEIVQYTKAYDPASNTVSNFPETNNDFSLVNGRFTYNLNGKLIFWGEKFVLNGENYDNVRDLMVSDGTAAGTSVLKEGPRRFDYPALQSSPALYEKNGYLYFAATNVNDATHVYKTNGTTAGTSKFITVSPPVATNVYPSDFMFREYNGNLLINIQFENTENDSSVLYLTDGTVPGTQNLSSYKNTFKYIFSQKFNNKFIVKDFDNTIRLFDPGAGSVSAPLAELITEEEWYANWGNNDAQVTVADGKIFMLYDHWLLSSDGNPGNTDTIIDLDTYVPGFGSTTNFSAMVNSRLIFDLHASDPFTRFHKVSTSTDNGTTALLGNYEIPVKRALEPGNLGSLTGFPTLGNSSFFTGLNDNGLQVWKTEGDPSSTEMLGPLQPGTFNTFMPLNGKMFFQGTDFYTGTTLYISDGTTPGTTLLKKLDDYFTQYHYVYKNTLYFIAYPIESSGNHALWKTDGTPEGTQLIRVFSQKALAKIFELNGELFIPAEDNDRELIWKIKETDEVVPIVKWSDLAISNGEFISMGLVNNRYIFNIKSALYEAFTHNHILGFNGSTTYYITNASLTNFNKNKYASISNSVVAGNTFYFTLLALADGTLPKATLFNEGFNFNENGYIIASDGSAGSAQIVEELDESLANINSVRHPYFGFNEIQANLIGLRNINDNLVTYLYSDNGQLYPVNYGNAPGYSLYRFNGNFEKLLDFEPSPGTVQIINTGLFGDHEYFLENYYPNNDSISSVLMRSDGTPAGSMVIDTIIKNAPRQYALYQGGVFNGKYYSLAIDDAVASNKFFETDLISTSTREITIEPSIDYISSIHFERNDGILMKALYLPGQEMRPGYSLWLYKNGIPSKVDDQVKKQLTLFPNPARNEVFLRLDSDHTNAILTVYGLNGEVVYSEVLPGNSPAARINTAPLSPGMYIIQLRQKGKVESGKFIKQ